MSRGISWSSSKSELKVIIGTVTRCHKHVLPRGVVVIVQDLAICQTIPVVLWTTTRILGSAARMENLPRHNSSDSCDSCDSFGEGCASPLRAALYIDEVVGLPRIRSGLV